MTNVAVVAAGVVIVSLAAAFVLTRLVDEAGPLTENSFLFAFRRTLFDINSITPCGSGMPPRNFGMEQIFTTIGFRHLTTFARKPSRFPVGLASNSLGHSQIPRALFVATLFLDLGESSNTSARLIGVNRVLLVMVCIWP